MTKYVRVRDKRHCEDGAGLPILYPIQIRKEDNHTCFTRLNAHLNGRLH